MNFIFVFSICFTINISKSLFLIQFAYAAFEFICSFCSKQPKAIKYKFELVDCSCLTGF